MFLSAADHSCIKAQNVFSVYSCCCTATTAVLQSLTDLTSYEGLVDLHMNLFLLISESQIPSMLLKRSDKDRCISFIMLFILFTLLCLSHLFSFCCSPHALFVLFIFFHFLHPLHLSSLCAPRAPVLSAGGPSWRS